MDIDEIRESNRKLIQKFLARKKTRLAKLSIIVYESLLNQFADDCKKLFQDLTTDDVREWLNNYINSGKKKKPNTIRQRVAIFRSFFNYLIYLGVITKSPITRRMRSKSKPMNLPKVLTESEKAIIKRHIEYFNLRDRAIYESLRSSGMRRSEIVSLDVSDVNLLKCCAHVTGKGNKKRTVPLSTEACHLIKQMLESHTGGEALFLNRYGTRLSSKHIWRICKKIQEETEMIHSFHPHMIRHSFATDSIISEKDLLQLRDELGHAELDTTMIYLHIPTPSLIIAYDKAMMNQ